MASSCAEHVSPSQHDFAREELPAFAESPQQAFDSSQHAAPSEQHFWTAAQHARSSAQQFISLSQQPSFLLAAQHALSFSQQAILVLQQSEGLFPSKARAPNASVEAAKSPAITFVNMMESPVKNWMV